MLDNANYPHEPEWMSSVLNPANFNGIRGEYGGYFSGGRYSYEFELPEITYETAYCPHLAVSPKSIPDTGSTGFMFIAVLVGMAVLKKLLKHP